MFSFLPNSILQMGTIFLSIVIEALPFVLLGCIISGCLHVFLTAERVKKIIPKNKLLGILVGCLLGFFFPSCECGIVPVVNQFLRKGVPEHTAFSFMLTAPIVNPIVIFSTYIAFSNSVKFALLRVLGSFFVAFVVGIWIAYFNRTPILKDKLSAGEHAEAEEPDHENHDDHNNHDHEVLSFRQKVWDALQHAIDEFFDTGRYLIFGGLIASAMQVFLPTSVLLTMTSSKLVAILLLIALALTMSLCSEADAFVGSSLLSLFGTAPVVGFLVYGPMVDIKNLLMMKRYFGTRFVASLVGIITVSVVVYAMIL